MNQTSDKPIANPAEDEACVVTENSGIGFADDDKRFAIWFCLLFVCVGSLVFVFKRTDLFPWPGACHPGGYDSDHYMAYCHSTRYGDYEHFALYNNLEPAAVASLKQAQVLFLGNSRTQYAFSTEAVIDYFKTSGVSHYVMGFGQAAMSPIASAMMEKHQLSPAMLVANVDPFFSSDINGTFQRVLDNERGLKGEFSRKQWLQGWQARVCENREHRMFKLVCSGRAETLYRSQNTGHWKTDYYRELKKIPVSYTDALMDQQEEVSAAVERFIQQSGIKRECLVLTVTPRSDTPMAFVKALADKTGLPVILPKLDNLYTIDYSHLHPESAIRWSSVFLKALDPHLERCATATALTSTD